MATGTQYEDKAKEWTRKPLKDRPWTYTFQSSSRLNFVSHRAAQGVTQTKRGPDDQAPTAHAITTKNVIVILFSNLFLCSMACFFDWGHIKSNDTVSRRHTEMSCPQTYHNNTVQARAGCHLKYCGRALLDNLIPSDHIEYLLSLAKKMDKMSGIPEDASATFDIRNDVTSAGQQGSSNIYRDVQDTLQRAISREFQISTSSLQRTSPTYLAKITPKTSTADESWLAHVRNTLHENVQFTAILYLGTYKTDFIGGRFIFVEDSQYTVIEPKKGRVSMFTGGPENRYYVERVLRGARYFFLTSLACNSSSVSNGE